ncbi:Sodium/glucose cotransporter [Novipirellula aureliae]|uniref:Sodium/glucose cotransporter n=1 Tax=Novipirellula aureliae TaxID=2527966 RepID=A0A5C6DQU1_9BACT|nr:sodium/solute symporter [Novipirellula aureliae]TWU39128.1 Sodium/glucose cotransporter [Novipirellula aureliae]
MNISTFDLSVIVFYLIGIMLIGIFSVRRKTGTGNEYFLAGRSLKWPVVGAALFASNISTIHLVGLAEGGYKYGLVMGNFEWMATFTLILLSLVFVPFYFKSKITTLPEYLEKRYCRQTRTIMAFMSIASALLIHIGISLYAGAAVFEEFFGLNVVASIVVISLVTSIYTVIGGLTAVVVTETVQTVILLAGAVLVTLLALFALPEVGIGSLSEFREATKPQQLSMLHASNADGFAWYAFLFGYPVLGVWYWCTDQTIVQRAIGAKDQANSQQGALFAGALKILPLFLMVLPGVFGYVLFKDQIGDEAAKTLPVMINELVPTGLKGIIAAALLAALMSTIAAALNSAGTLMAVDIVGHFRPQTSDRQQVLIGRMTAIVVMLLAMVWSTQGDKFGSIFEAINKMPAQFLAPPITVVFLWGVFWPRGTKQAALVTLILGFVLGFVVFLIDLPAFGDVQWVSDAEHGLGIGFMMQAAWGFIIWSAVYVIVSLATPRPSREQTELTTWPNPLQVIFHGPLVGWSDPRLIACFLLAIMGVFYFALG